jgi:hypothetical protein
MEANLSANLHLKFVFGTRRLLDVTADDIELFLRERGRSEEASSVESMFQRRVSCRDQTVAQAALRNVVGTTAD